MYSKTLRYADFGPNSISVAQKTVYLEVIWKTSKTVYLWGLVPKNDNQCNFWQNLKPCIFKISASWGHVAQGLAVLGKILTVYLEVIWKTFKTVYLWGLVPKNDNQCNFWQNFTPCIFKISASWGLVAQGLTVLSMPPKSEFCYVN